MTPNTEIAVAMSGGRRHHLAALWRTEIAGKVRENVVRGERANHAVQEKFTVKTVEWPCQPYDPFFNINTPDDLSRARAMVAQGPNASMPT